MKKPSSNKATPRHFTLGFTAAEKARIDKAARICGAKDGRSAIWARYMLLTNVSTILGIARRGQKI